MSSSCLVLAKSTSQLLKQSVDSYLSSGAIYGWATPTSFPTHIFSIPNLPAFDPAHNATSKMQAAGHCVIKEVDRRIVKDRAELSANGFENPASSALKFRSPCALLPSDLTLSIQLSAQQSQSPFAGSSPPPLCSFVFAASVAPLPPSYPAHLYREYYASLFHPTGASILSPPIPEISYLLYSTSCGLVLKGHGEILESPRLWQRAGTFAIVMMFVQGLLVLLLVRQMETGRGLGNVVKVAYGSIALQAAMDSYFFVSLVVLPPSFTSPLADSWGNRQILTFTIGVVTSESRLKRLFFSDPPNSLVLIQKKTPGPPFPFSSPRSSP